MAAQLPWVEVDAFVEGVAAVAVAAEDAVADFVEVVPELAAALAAFWLLLALAAMQPVISIMPAMPAAPATLRASRAGCGRRLRAGRAAGVLVALAASVATSWVVIGDSFGVVVVVPTG